MLIFIPMNLRVTQISVIWCIALFLIGLTLSEAQQAPAWIELDGREDTYPKSEYYSGFNTAKFRKNDDLATVRNYVETLSRNELSEVLYQSVNSAAQVRGDYPKSSFSRTKMEECGMETSTYLDKKEGTAYAISFIPIKTMKTYYYKELSQSMDEMEQKIGIANEITNKGQAYARYMELIDELDAINSDRLLLRNLGITNDVALMTSKWEGFKQFVEDRAEELRNVKDITLDEASFFLIEKLMHDKDIEEFTVKLQPATYKNMEIATEFSLRFNQLLSYDLIKKGVKVKTGNASSTNIILKGTYWPRIDKIQVSLDLREDFGDGMDLVIGSATVYIPIEAVEAENLHYEPKITQQALHKNTLLMNRVTNGGMDATVSTQNGEESLVFKEGEPLELYIEVNRPSYIRLLNVWSDDQQLLLIDNYYVSEENINTKIKMPFDWVTACPCGTEYIQLFARSEPFGYIDIETEDGFDFVTEPLETTVNKSRGYQMVKKPGSYVTESTIVLTTMEK